MDLTGEIDFNSALVAREDGFRQSAAATSGPLYYATNDRGQQVVGRLSDGKPCRRTSSRVTRANAGGQRRGVGQPAISRGHVRSAAPTECSSTATRRHAAEVALTAPAQDSTAGDELASR